MEILTTPLQKFELERRDELGATFRDTSRNWNGILTPIGCTMGYQELWTCCFYSCVTPEWAFSGGIRTMGVIITTMDVIAFQSRALLH